MPKSIVASTVFTRLFLAFSMVLAITIAAQAGPKEEVQAAIANSDKIISAGNVDGTVALYAPDAVFWGTRSKEWATTPAAIKTYLTGALKAVRQVRTHDVTMAELSNTVVRVAGLIEITREENGQTAKTDNAISAVWVKSGDKWRIAQIQVSPRSQ